MGYTIVENFSIQGEDRVQEFREFMSSNMNNSSLRAPIKSWQKDQSYAVSLSSNIKDILTLETLFKKWVEQDNRVTYNHSEGGIFAWFKKLF